MKSAIFTSFDKDLPLPEATAMIRAAGFEVVAIGAGPGRPGYTTAEGRDEIRRLFAQHGLAIDSLHAPFPSGDRLYSLDEDERTESVRLCIQALEAAAELDGRIVVIHLIQPYGIPEGDVRNRMIEHGRRSVAALADRAAALGVRLALENGQRAAYDRVLIDLLAEFDVPHVGLCYDTGHENVQGTCFALLERFAHRLLTLHVHDNAGTDAHLLPGEGTIDWEAFRRVLHGTGYDGSVLLEAGTANSRHKNPATFLAEAWKQAERLRQPLLGAPVRTRHAVSVQGREA